ncbi:MAG: neutral/alkaline non-lysosomal ceramidase N-terminal domain-containing protein, partial [Spirosomaceae bacterium]|nr:neutral/alkaline non-lysosomal ceramidase N-terminal domain-containing protein [Spirosomataceae bacterium]
QWKGYQAGFAAVAITPTLPDTWTDANQDAQFEPEDGDTYQDLNKNGRFDAVWMAGFQNKRAANGIHDDLWARAMVLDDGQTRLAVVSVDLIGFTHKNVVNVRKQLDASWGITYATISSTHTHEGPDMLGMWGDSEFKSGVDADYEKWVEKQVVSAIEQAVKNLKPAKLRVAQDLTGAQALTTDTRKPIVKDDGLYILQAQDATTNATLGTYIVWGNHPEVLWNKNTLITSDFAHYLRQGVEKGVFNDNKEVKKGTGGVVVYATGCLGGLMTTDPRVAVKHPFKDTLYQEPSYHKAEVTGSTLALLILKALDNAEPLSGGIDLRAKTLELPLDNTDFRLGVALGVVDAGYSSWGKLRTEIAVWHIGEASFLSVPGEIYPELVNGGVEAPQYADFDLKKPLETPPLRSLMRGKYKFVIGLANDEIGYILPKSYWDVAPPFTYGEKEAPYGEVNSVGPETGPLLHHAYKTLLAR